MNKKTLWITETAVMIALLVALQWATKPLGQFVTGSCVNLVLGVSVLVGGLWCGLTVALVSPFFAFLLGIGPALVQVVPVIACGNANLAGLFGLSCRKEWKRELAMVGSAVLKCAFLWAAVPAVIASLGTVPAKQAAVMSAMFSWPQGVTALIGGVLALVILPRLKKARFNG